MICDIIIPVWNRLQLTQKCIKSIIKHTHFPYRLILIDNYSDQETEFYLKGIKEHLGQGMEIIRNEQNLGFVKAINQGMRVSQADYLCLLNNDTEVGENWLEELISVAQSSPRIGIVNPGADSSFLNDSAALKGKWVEVGFASGFCMLIKKEVKDKIGLLDEAYQTGFWEETDYSQRAKIAGYICVSAKGACVQHHGHKTFEYFGKDRVNDLFDKNKELFFKKWGRILQIAYVFLKKSIGPQEAGDILKLARQGHTVYLFLKNSTEIKANINHGSVRQYKSPDIFFHIYVGGKILIRNLGKKRFNKIIIDSSKFAKLLHFLNRNLHLEII